MTTHAVSEAYIEIIFIVSVYCLTYAHLWEAGANDIELHEILLAYTKRWAIYLYYIIMIVADIWLHA